MNLKGFIDSANVLSDIGKLAFAQYFQWEENEKKSTYHNKEIIQDQKIHRQKSKTSKEMHLKKSYNSLQMHFQSLNSDLMVFARESERDMFDQRNGSFQMMIVASSFLFNTLATVIAQPNINDNTSHDFRIAISLCSSVSLGCLFLCIIFSVELIKGISYFMYKKSEQHAIYTEKIINHYKREILEWMETYGPNHTIFDAGNSELSGDESSNDCYESEFYPLTISNRARVYIAKMDETQIDKLFDEHEDKITKLMDKREKLNKQFEEEDQFHNYWRKYCYKKALISNLLFYLGCFSLLVTLALIGWKQYIAQYNAIIAGIIFIVVIDDTEHGLVDHNLDRWALEYIICSILVNEITNHQFITTNKICKTIWYY
eukprot:gene5928-8175_t